MTARHLGVDVGGTNCKLAVVESAGDRPGPPGDRPRLLATTTVPTGSGEPGEIVERVAAAAAGLLAAHGPVAAAGVGVPGLFDEATGRTLLLPNLPAAWNGYRLRGPLADRLGVPTALINDARAFALAESRLGAAAGCSTVVCLTLGTGVGGDVVIDGRLRFGPHGRAGEVGHQVIDPAGPPCGCGNRGCVEAFAAGPALCRLGGQASPEAVFAAAGDPRAGAAVQAVVGRLAVGIANMVTVLWPERVVVGGGLAAAGGAAVRAPAAGRGGGGAAGRPGGPRDRARRPGPGRRRHRDRPVGPGAGRHRTRAGRRHGWVWTTSMT